MRHGSSRYSNMGCRCDDCREGKAAADRAYQQRLKLDHDQFRPASSGDLVFDILETEGSWLTTSEICDAAERIAGLKPQVTTRALWRLVGRNGAVERRLEGREAMFRVPVRGYLYESEDDL